MINRIYNLVLFISNNELRGNISPQEFNLALYNAVIEIYESYLFELNRSINRMNKGLVNNNFANVAKYYRERIKYYLTKATIVGVTVDGETTFALPSDLRYIDGVYYNNNEVEPVGNSSQFLLADKLPDVLLDEEYPIYLQESTSLSVLPATIIDELKIYYLRHPLKPNWTYQSISGNPVFNPSASDFQDVDMHASEEGNLIRLVLLQMGINLKEQDLASYMQNYENQKFQHENLS